MAFCSLFVELTTLSKQLFIITLHYLIQRSMKIRFNGLGPVDYFQSFLLSLKDSPPPISQKNSSKNFCPTDFPSSFCCCLENYFASQIWRGFSSASKIILPPILVFVSSSIIFGAIPNFATEKEQKRNFLDFNDVTLVVVDIKSERIVKSPCLQQDLFDMTMVTII